jgi:hypothetical protein
VNGGETAFEGYGYRTRSPFGSWTKVRVGGGTVSITGLRVGVLPYRLWTASQVLLLVLIVPALLAAVVFCDWRYLLLGLGLLVAHWFVGAMGAAGMWEMANMIAMDSGHPTVVPDSGQGTRAVA